MSPSSGLTGFRADLLRSKREARGWSCEQLALMASVTPGTVRKAEAGPGNPSPRVVGALAAALSVNVAELAPTGDLSLRQLRARRGVTQKIVAAEVGVSTGMVSKVETGKYGVRNPARWAPAYGVSVRDWTKAWNAGRETHRRRIRSQPPRASQEVRE
ncbi:MULTISPECIES: helix-turn-helix domain-containing protein [Streptomyces]|uniref:Transcriptional regulator n=1 Tax=Streptomyces jumonjinensis TaxID=1945 RepID=A0A646KKR8_STRJU|nr:transcriptional regulator [Streptomyces jumonjinensis]